MRKKIINTKDMTIDEKKELREKLKAEYDEKLRMARENLPGLKERLKAKGYILTDDFKVSKIVDGVAVWLSPVAALNVINEKPEVTQQDKNRMIWSLRKEGKLRTPFFERPYIRAFIIMCFIVVGFPFLALTTINLTKIFIDIKKGEYNNFDYVYHRETAIRHGEDFYHNNSKLLPTTETEEERKNRYKTERARIWADFKDPEGSTQKYRESMKEFHQYTREHMKEWNLASKVYFTYTFLKDEVSYFIEWLSVKITTSDFWFSIDEKYDPYRLKSDIVDALITPFILGPIVAAFLYPVTIVFASFFLTIFLPKYLYEDTCMTDDEIESATTVLAVLAAKSVFDSTKEQKRREDNPIKFDD